MIRKGKEEIGKEVAEELKAIWFHPAGHLTSPWYDPITHGYYVSQVSGARRVGLVRNPISSNFKIGFVELGFCYL